MNEGLRRRFTFRYDIEKYSPTELKEIFLLKVKNDDWKVGFLNNKNNKKDSDKLQKFFEDNHEKFQNFGGDIETLLLNCKIVHCKRVLFDDPSNRRNLNINDIEEGFNSFIKNRKYNENPYKDFPKHLFI